MELVPSLPHPCSRSHASLPAGTCCWPCLFLITTSHSPPNRAAPYWHLCTTLWQGLPLQAAALAWGPGRGLELKPCSAQRGWAPLPAASAALGLGGSRPQCGKQGLPACPDTAAITCCRPRLSTPCPAFPMLPCPSPTRRVSGVPPDDSHLPLGAWSLHIPRACPVLPDPGPEGLGLGAVEEGPGGPRRMAPNLPPALPGLVLLRVTPPRFPSSGSDGSRRWCYTS